MAVARVSLFNRLKKSGLRAIIVSSVHDSIVVDSPNEEIDKVAKIMYDVFNDLPKNILKLFGYVTNVPYACEVKVGANLTDMEKYVTV